ncbi:MAG: ABC transporter ATP-binding protein [Vampirovibrionales bacterium]|nr:ABC transporter ATP-binding protein [Vampirovibrionales bacterium]
MTVAPEASTPVKPYGNKPNHDGIVVRDLSKCFKSGNHAVQALSHVSLEAYSGQVLGILGSNGAGKTTLLNILTTVTRPDAGEAWVGGYSVLTQAEQVRQRLGVVSQDDRFDTYLTLWENLSLHAELHGMPKRQFVPRIERLLKQVDLYERRNSYVELFSGGMRRKASLIRALIHEPAILFLDEPTTGLDPVARRQVWDAILSLRVGRTLVLTTHYMEEADQLCDTLVLMDKGQVLTSGTPTQLKQQVARQQKAALGGQALWQCRFSQPVAGQWLESLQAKAPAGSVIKTPKEDTLHVMMPLENSHWLWVWAASLPQNTLTAIEQPLPSLETVFFALVDKPIALNEDLVSGGLV